MEVDDMWTGHLQWHDGNGGRAQEGMCVMTEHAVVLYRGSDVARHMPWEDIAALEEDDNGWFEFEPCGVRVRARNPADGTFVHVVHRHHTKTELASAAARSRIPPWLFEDVPDDLRPALQAFYERDREPGFLWAGWVDRRDLSSAEVFSKRALIVTPQAVYTLQPDTGSVSRCLAHARVARVSTTNRRDLWFRVPPEYDLIVREPTGKLHQRLALLYSPIHTVPSFAGARLAIPPAFLHGKPIPIVVHDATSLRRGLSSDAASTPHMQTLSSYVAFQEEPLRTPARSQRNSIASVSSSNVLEDSVLSPQSPVVPLVVRPLVGVPPERGSPPPRTLLDRRRSSLLPPQAASDTESPSHAPAACEPATREREAPTNRDHPLATPPSAPTPGRFAQIPPLSPVRAETSEFLTSAAAVVAVALGTDRALAGALVPPGPGGPTVNAMSVAAAAAAAASSPPRVPAPRRRVSLGSAFSDDAAGAGGTFGSRQRTLSPMGAGHTSSDEEDAGGGAVDGSPRLPWDGASDEEEDVGAAGRKRLHVEDSSSGEGGHARGRMRADVYDVWALPVVTRRLGGGGPWTTPRRASTPPTPTRLAHIRTPTVHSDGTPGGVFVATPLASKRSSGGWGGGQDAHLQHLAHTQYYSPQYTSPVGSALRVGAHATVSTPTERERSTPPGVPHRVTPTTAPPQVFLPTHPSLATFASLSQMSAVSGSSYHSGGVGGGGGGGGGAAGVSSLGSPCTNASVGALGTPTSARTGVGSASAPAQTPRACEPPHLLTLHAAASGGECGGGVGRDSPSLLTTGVDSWRESRRSSDGPVHGAVAELAKVATARQLTPRGSRGGVEEGVASPATLRSIPMAVEVDCSSGVPSPLHGFVFAGSPRMTFASPSHASFVSPTSPSDAGDANASPISSSSPARSRERHHHAAVAVGSPVHHSVAEASTETAIGSGGGGGGGSGASGATPTTVPAVRSPISPPAAILSSDTVRRAGTPGTPGTAFASSSLTSPDAPSGPGPTQVVSPLAGRSMPPQAVVPGGGADPVLGISPPAAAMSPLLRHMCTSHTATVPREADSDTPGASPSPHKPVVGGGARTTSSPAASSPHPSIAERRTAPCVSVALPHGVGGHSDHVVPAQPAWEAHPAAVPPRDPRTGVPYVPFADLGAGLGACLAPLYHHQQPHIVWAGHVVRGAGVTQASLPSHPLRVLVLTPDCVYLLAARAVVVRCLPLAALSSLYVERRGGGGAARRAASTAAAGLPAVALTAPSHYDLLCSFLSDDAAGGFARLVHLLGAAFVGEAVPVHAVQRVDPSLFNLEKPPNWVAPRVIPIQATKLRRVAREPEPGPSPSSDPH